MFIFLAFWIFWIIVIWILIFFHLYMYACFIFYICTLSLLVPQLLHKHITQGEYNSIFPSALGWNYIYSSLLYNLKLPVLYLSNSMYFALLHFLGQIFY